jgi:hypothetical protein
MAPPSGLVDQVNVVRASVQFEDPTAQMCVVTITPVLDTVPFVPGMALGGSGTGVTVVLQTAPPSPPGAHAALITGGGAGPPITHRLTGAAVESREPRGARAGLANRATVRPASATIISKRGCPGAVVGAGRGGADPGARTATGRWGARADSAGGGRSSAEPKERSPIAARLACGWCRGIAIAVTGDTYKTAVVIRAAVGPTRGSGT